MKKFLLLLITITLAMGLAGCSSADKPSVSMPTPSTSGGEVQLPDQPF